MSFDQDRMDAETQRHTREMEVATGDGHGLENARMGLLSVYRAMNRLDGGKSGEELAELVEAARVLSTIINGAE